MQYFLILKQPSFLKLMCLDLLIMIDVQEREKEEERRREEASKLRVKLNHFLIHKTALPDLTLDSISNTYCNNGCQC